MLLGSWLKQACWHSWQRSDSKQTPTTMSATNPLGGSTSSTAAPLARARWLQPIRGEFWPEEPGLGRDSARLWGSRSSSVAAAAGSSGCFPLWAPLTAVKQEAAAALSSTSDRDSLFFQSSYNPPFTTSSFCVHLFLSFDKLKEQQQKKRRRGK